MQCNAVNDIILVVCILLLVDIKPGQYMLTDRWTLEDTLPAVEVRE